MKRHLGVCQGAGAVKPNAHEMALKQDKLKKKRALLTFLMAAHLA